MSEQSIEPGKVKPEDTSFALEQHHEAMQMAKDFCMIISQTCRKKQSESMEFNKTIEFATLIAGYTVGTMAGTMAGGVTDPDSLIDQFLENMVTPHVKVFAKEVADDFSKVLAEAQAETSTKQ